MNFDTRGYLAPGIHDAGADQIEEHLVKAFPTSQTRPQIFAGYSLHAETLRSLGLKVEQFIDGSFASTKNDPGDIDLVCFIDAATVDALAPNQQALLESLVSGPLTKTAFSCDAYFAPTYPDGHPNSGEARSTRKYWMGEFGYDRLDQPKGIVRTVVEPAQP